MSTEQRTENVFHHCDLLIFTETDGGVEWTAVSGNEKGRTAINGIINSEINWDWNGSGQRICVDAGAPPDWRTTDICLPRLERDGLAARVPGVAEIGFQVPGVANVDANVLRTSARLGSGARIYGGPDLRVIIYDPLLGHFGLVVGRPYHR